MATPDTLTPETAVAYVRATAAGWGNEWADAIISSAQLSREDDTEVVIVTSSAGEWVVWIGDNGRLYGEV